MYGDHAECYSKVEEAEGKLKRLMEQLEELYQMANELKRGAETDGKRLLEQLGKEQAKWEITKTELEQKVETLESKVQELRVVLKSNVAMEADPDKLSKPTASVVWCLLLAATMVAHNSKNAHGPRKTPHGITTASEPAYDTHLCLHLPLLQL